MGIDGMLEREDFYKVLQETLIKYYAEVRHKIVNCSYEPFEEGEELRLFSIGSLVCRANKPKGARVFLNAELNVRSSLWKYLAGKILVQYMMITRSAFSPGRFFLTKNALGNNEIISPQNRSIRIFDYDKSQVDCIIKQGFTDKYFNNQIAFRKQYNYDFMVPLIDSGDGWFREPILCGHPLARVTGKSKYQKGIDTAVQYIHKLADDTLEFIPSQEYVSELLTKALRLTEEAKQKKRIKTYNKCLVLLEFVDKGLNNVSMNIPTCMSHGDFQTGNIWMNDDGKVLLYDWETAGRRSVWYDSSTLLYSLRKPEGWFQFMNNKDLANTLPCDPIKNREEKEFDLIKKIVLLEDFLFLIEDMIELPCDWGNEVFDKKIDNISLTINIKQNEDKR